MRLAGARPFADYFQERLPFHWRTASPALLCRRTSQLMRICYFHEDTLYNTQGCIIIYYKMKTILQLQSFIIILMFSSKGTGIHKITRR